MKKSKNDGLNIVDTYILLIITILSVVSRTWIIYHPSDVTFDEVYFGNFTNYYLNGTYFYDIHPPFGKLIMALVAYIAGYDGTIQFEDYYGLSYTNPDYITLRFTPAFFGSFCSPLVYISLRFSSFSRISSFVSSILIILDTSILTEHRFILSDGMLHFFVCLFLAVFSYAVSIELYSKEWTIATIAAGFALGMAASSKNTSWGLMPYAAFVEIFQVISKYRRFDTMIALEIVYIGLLLIIPMLSVYFLSFFVHIIVLDKYGPGVDYLELGEEYQFVLPGRADGTLLARRLRKPSLLKRVVKLAIDMHQGNMGITEFHPSQSQPYNWPLLTGRYVDFWNGFTAEVHCNGNPLIYYLVFISIICSLFSCKCKKYYLAIRYIVGWSVSYFPFFLVPRTMYLYHYIIPLIFGIMNIGALMDLWFTPFWRGFVGVFVMFIALIGFYLFCPFSYGIKHVDRLLLEWSERWENGDEYFKSQSMLPPID